MLDDVLLVNSVFCMIADHDLVFGRCRNKEPHSSGILLCRVVVVGYENIYFYGSTMYGWKVIVHGMSRTPPKSTKFEFQKHTCHSQQLWSEGTRFLGLPSASTSFSSKPFLLLFQSFSPVFLLLTSLDFSLPDSSGTFELHIGFSKAPCSASHFS